MNQTSWEKSSESTVFHKGRQEDMGEILEQKLSAATLFPN